MPVRHSGFPSPATDYQGDAIDLNELLVDNRHATFFMRAVGEEMEGAFVAPESLLIVDRSEAVEDGALVIAYVDDAFYIRRYRVLEDGRRQLEAQPRRGATPAAITLDNSEEVIIWGVVVHIVVNPKIVWLNDRTR